MKSLKNSCVTAALICNLSLSIGCQSLPWGSKQNDQTALNAQQYADEVVADILYDTTVDLDTNYQPPAERSYSAAPVSASPRRSSGGGSCCN